MIKIQWLASIWRQNDQNVELRRKTFKTKLNYKSDQNNELHRFDVKNDQNVELRRKTFKTKQNIENNATTKVIKIQWLASIWRQNDQNVELRRKTFKTKLNYKSDRFEIQWLASIWRQNDQNVELRRKTFKTKLNYKSDQNPMTCIDLTSKRSKCWVTSQNIQNKAKLQKWSKSNDLHRFDVKTIKMLSYVAKHSKQS